MSLRRLLLLAMTYLLIVALVAFGVPLVLTIRQRVDAEVRSQARGSADVVAISAAALIADPDANANGLSTLVTRSARAARGRVVVVGATGNVVADSAGPATRGADYSTRAEIAQALRGRRVQDERRSETLRQEILVTSAPVVVAGRFRGAVRITQDVGAVERAVRRNIAGLALVGSFVLVLGFMVALLLARRLSRPMRGLEQAAAKVAGGDLGVQVREAGSSEQRSLARAFNAMTARVARVLDAQEQFVADASHHLRTPLTGLRLQLEQLAATPPDARSRDRLTTATAELDRLSQTIDELLILSTTGERGTTGQAVAISAVARSAVARWEPAAAERDQELILSERRPGVTVWASPVDLERAVDVLLDNAVRYAPMGTTVTVAVDHDTIEVADQGPGLSSQDADELFARFRRGSAGDGGPPGTGLGLAIARELSQRWGGETTLTNGDGGGARARLRVPALSDPLPGSS